MFDIRIEVRPVPIVLCLFDGGDVTVMGRRSTAKDHPCACEDGYAKRAGLHKMVFSAVKNGANNQCPGYGLWLE